MGKGAAKGTVLNVNSKAVASLNSISGPNQSADTIDLTALDSADGYREFVGGLKDGGEVTVGGFFNYGDGGQDEVRSAFESGAAVPCSIVFPAAIGASWSFNAVVTAVETGAELEDAVSFSATLKVSGKPALGATVPVITIAQQPAGGALGTTLFVAAKSTSGTPTYQWYSNSAASTIGAVTVPSETKAYYAPSAAKYYLCVISVAGGTSVTTDIVKVTV